MALDGVTRWALSEAVKAVLQHKLPHPFFPAPNELRRLCDEAQRPHQEYERRVRLTEQQIAERRAFAEVEARKTPAARARVSAAYQRFCAAYEREVEPDAPMLDPDLVDKVPDAPSQFKKPAAA